MKIAILGSASSPWLPEVLDGFVDAGFEVHLLHVFMEEQHTYIDAKSESVMRESSRIQARVASFQKLELKGRGMLKYFRLASMVRAAMRSLDVECLLTLYAGGFGLSAFLSGYRPYAVYAIGGDVLACSGYRRWLTRLVFNRACLIPANGEYITKEALRLAPQANIQCLLHGIDVERFTPLPDKPTSPIRIVCSRGFQPVYNNEQLIRALSYLTNVSVEWSCSFLAGGPLLKAAQEEARRILPPQVLERVTFRGGVSQSELKKEFQRSHIYVSMSRYDSTSMALLEAMACGAFVVASDIAPNRPWIEGNVQGAIPIPLDNAEALGQALIELIENPERLQSALIANRQLVVSRASGKVTLRALVPMLRESFSKTKP